MNVLLDHINAMLVSGTVLLMVMGVVSMGTEANIDTTRYYANRSQFNSFIDVLKHDFHNLGAGVPLADSMILGFQWDESAKYIEFLAIIDTTEAAPVEQVKYLLAEMDSIMVEEEGVSQRVPAYELQRLIKSGGSYKHTGASMPTIVDLSIELQSASGAAVTADLNSARIILITIEHVSTLGEDSVVGQITWQHRMRPYSLAMR